MSGPAAASAGQYRAPAGLREKLMAAVRPEFRVDELAFDPADPVFGGAICRVARLPPDSARRPGTVLRPP